MRINQLKAGVILTYASQAIHILSGIIYTPIMLRLLGQSEYGLYQLVASVVSYLSLLSMGFGAGYIRVYSQYKAKDDSIGIAKLNGMFMAVFSGISLISLLCGSVMLGNVRVIFGSGLSDAELDKAKVLMTMMVINLAVSLIDSVFNCYVTAKENFFFQKAVNFLKSLLNPFIALPLLIMGYGSVGLVAVSSFLAIASIVVDLWFCVKKLSMKFIFKGFDLKLLKSIWVFTFFIFMNMIIDQINWSVDKFLLGRLIGTTAVAVYGVAGALNSMYLTFSTAVSGVFVPRVNSFVASENDNNKLTKLFTRVGRIQFIILALIISGYILFGKEFIGFWAGTGYDEAYFVGILLMVPVTVPLIQNLGIEIQRAKNMHKARSLVYLAIAIVNVFLSIPLIKLWGATGAAVGTAISLVLGNGLFMNIYYHKKIGLNMLYFWKEIFKFIPAATTSAVFGIIIKYFIPAGNILSLILGIALYSVVYVLSMWFMGMNKSEKELLSGPIRKIFKR